MFIWAKISDNIEFEQVFQSKSFLGHSSQIHQIHVKSKILKFLKYGVFWNGGMFFSIFDVKYFLNERTIT